MFTTGRTVLVTGSTDGIGKQTAVTLAGQGGRVLIHGRNPQKVDRTISEIKKRYPDADLAGYVAEFSSLDSVRKLVDEINQKEASLHVLINNAGIYSPDFGLSQDGFELTFAVNQLAPFLLTLSLLEKIKASQAARIINVTSIAHGVHDLDMNKIHDENSFRAWRAYKISKFANILFTYTLAERLQDSQVTVNCLHPGTVNTKVLRSAFPEMQGISLEEGARSSIYLASTEDLDGVTGKYFEESKPAESAPQTYDKEIQQTMWEQCERWVGYQEN
ncbi:MAG TPA: short-chain dehydrogenase [Anaerolineaceae bacterium]|uniref:Oxidoreductase, short chain dehydrogenase/reductase family n=1 Tax=Anaerolinea thermophila TaxID=167964 RepID=A0A101FYA4_9CHLR|nr:MAG: Oxidoreductase, short chain dehydrogenase/reductase family [Anaerolinea thermophila]HAF61738.1 short-chain dehydrogenase [Anaerolineaceae bacterium]